MFRRSFLTTLLAPLAAPFIRLPEPEPPEEADWPAVDFIPIDCFIEFEDAATYGPGLTATIH
ncbi:unnamed protein product [marine sediment metagenome]|uniref:Uncharacterized protein n=1 Tax=marine sediment metagenome TaxID=412755 RepID=X0UHA1_9ZZZZ